MRKSYWKFFRSALGQKRFGWLLRQGLKIPLIRMDHRFRGVPKKWLGPIQGIFFVTYACNLRCYFCDLPLRHLEYVKKGMKELSAGEKLAVIDDFAKIGTTGLGFTGGEPSLLPEIYDLVERARQKGMVPHLSTNGYAFRTPESCAKFLDAGLMGTTISVDGPEALHNHIRGRDDSHQTVVQGIRNILEARRQRHLNFSVITTTVITKDNIAVIPELVEELKKLGVDKIGFMPVNEIGLDYDVALRKNNFLLPADSAATPLRKLIASLENLGKEGLLENSPEYIGLFEEALTGKPLPIRCFAGYTTLTIDSWGDIYPCFSWASMRQSCGNVREKTLAEFWRGREMEEVRNKVKKCRDCFWNCQTELNLLVSKKRVPA